MGDPVDDFDGPFLTPKRLEWELIRRRLQMQVTDGETLFQKMSPPPEGHWDRVDNNIIGIMAPAFGRNPDGSLTAEAMAGLRSQLEREAAARAALPQADEAAAAAAFYAGIGPDEILYRLYRFELLRFGGQIAYGRPPETLYERALFNRFLQLRAEGRIVFDPTNNEFIPNGQPQFPNRGLPTYSGSEPEHILDDQQQQPGSNQQPPAPSIWLGPGLPGFGVIPGGVVPGAVTPVGPGVPPPNGPPGGVVAPPPREVLPGPDPFQGPFPDDLFRINPADP